MAQTPSGTSESQNPNTISDNTRTTSNAPNVPSSELNRVHFNVNSKDAARVSDIQLKQPSFAQLLKNAITMDNFKTLLRDPCLSYSFATGTIVGVTSGMAFQHYRQCSVGKMLNVGFFVSLIGSLFTWEYCTLTREATKMKRINVLIEEKRKEIEKRPRPMA